LQVAEVGHDLGDSHSAGIVDWQESNLSTHSVRMMPSLSTDATVTDRAAMEMRAGRALRPSAIVGLGIRK
jgi:hypothetical protein